MKVLIKEKLSQHKFKDRNGYLICVDAVLARTGKQTYRKSEVFSTDEDTEIDVDRKPEEVFSQETLASFENVPLTVEHPNEDVNSENYKDYSVGFVRDIHKGIVDGQEVILGTLVIQDQQTIDEIENGEHTDLSCGYDCDIVDEENPQQRNIRGNHVALCQCGRAGNARIIDSILLDSKDFDKMSLDELKKTRDELSKLEKKLRDYNIYSNELDNKQKELQKIIDKKLFGDSIDNEKIYTYIMFGTTGEKRVDNLTLAEAEHLLKNNKLLGYDGKIIKTSEIKDKLIESSSEEAFKKNIATEIKAGKDPKQAAAIAYSIQRENDSIKDANIVANIYNRNGKLLETKTFNSRVQLDNYANSLENLYDMTEEKELYKNNRGELDILKEWKIVIDTSVQDDADWQSYRPLELVKVEVWNYDINSYDAKNPYYMITIYYKDHHGFDKHETRPVTIDKKGNFTFSFDGKSVKRHVGDSHTNIEKEEILNMSSKDSKVAIACSVKEKNDVIKDAMKYGITTWRRYKNGYKKPERVYNDLSQAKYDKDALERADGIDYVIFEIETGKMIDSLASTNEEVTKKLEKNFENFKEEKMKDSFAILHPNKYEFLSVGGRSWVKEDSNMIQYFESENAAKIFGDKYVNSQYRIIKINDSIKDSLDQTEIEVIEDAIYWLKKEGKEITVNNILKQINKDMAGFLGANQGRIVNYLKSEKHIKDSKPDLIKLFKLAKIAKDSINK